MQDLIAGFIERLPAIVRDIQASYDSDDSEGLLRLAHQLKGSAGGYGFQPISEVAATLEAAARQPEAPDELASALEQFKRTCERVEILGRR